MSSGIPVQIGNDWTAVQAGPFSGRFDVLTGDLVILRIAASPPASDAGGIRTNDSMPFTVVEGETLYARAYDGSAIVQVDAGLAQVVRPSLDLMTNRGGPATRLRVDGGRTGFWLGREFRTFKQLNLTTGTPYVLKVVSPIDFILQSLDTSIDSGTLETGIYVGGTEGGTFSETLPIFSRNSMASRPTPFYTPQIVITAGGTHTGGTLIRPARLKVANATAQQSTVGSPGGADDESGNPAGTYYIRMTAIETPVVGVANAYWEERP